LPRVLWGGHCVAGPGLSWRLCGGGGGVGCVGVSRVSAALPPELARARVTAAVAKPPAGCLERPPVVAKPLTGRFFPEERRPDTQQAEETLYSQHRPLRRQTISTEVKRFRNRASGH
jgi:hypothetical protein